MKLSLKPFRNLVTVNLQRIEDNANRLLIGMSAVKRSQVTPQIFLGGQYKLSNLITLKELGITAIVNMRTLSLKPELEKAGFKVLELPTPDLHAPSQTQLRQGVKFIAKQLEAKGKVYVHCHFGEGRGPTMVIAYFISQGMSFTDAYAKVEKVRPFIMLTPMQFQALQEFAETYPSFTDS